MTEVNKFNLIIQIFRVSMYFIAGLAIIFIPFPLFKNSGQLKIVLGLIFMAYSGFRTYQLIQNKKNEENNRE
jgi:hypothetical protein